MACQRKIALSLAAFAAALLAKVVLIARLTTV
jgi:hypothetical protein